MQVKSIENGTVYDLTAIDAGSGKIGSTPEDISHRIGRGSDKLRMNEAVALMKEANWDEKSIIANITNAIDNGFYEFAVRIGDAAVALGPDGLGLTAAQVAKVLDEETDVEIGDIAGALYHTSGLNLEAEEVAKALADREGLGFSPEKIAKVFTEDFNMSPADVAESLYASDGADLSAEEVALALYSENGADLPLVSVANALSEGVGLSRGKIAIAMYSEEGLDMSAADVAQALYAADGLDLSVSEVVDVLYNRSGLDLDAPEIAGALSKGLNLREQGDIARAMCHLGFEAIEEALLPNGIEGKEDIEFLLDELDWTTDDLWRACSDDASRKVILNEVAKENPEKAVQFMGKSGRSGQDIAEYLNKEHGLAAPDIAEALADGLDIEADQVKQIMKDAGISQKPARPCPSRKQDFDLGR